MLLTNISLVPDFYSAMLHSAKIQNCKKNSCSWTAGEKTKFEQVNWSILISSLVWQEKSASHFFLGRYIPDATGAIYDVLKEMTTLQASKKKRYNEEDTELLKKVSSRLITKNTLMEKLAEHVEQVSFCPDLGPRILLANPNFGWASLTISVPNCQSLRYVMLYVQLSKFTVIFVILQFMLYETNLTDKTFTALWSHCLMN